MKGTFFQKPLEYKIDINGDSWAQGDSIQGSLIVQNHSNDEIDLASTGCHLCSISHKKLKTKDKSALNMLNQKVFENTKISALSQTNFDFNFQLAPDSSITDTTEGLYLICGQLETPFDGGILQLKITPIKIISDFVEIFENFFKFKFKALKNKKPFIEAKITPPDSKEWTAIQTMSLKMRMIESKLALDFNFKVKKMAYDLDVVLTKDKQIIINKLLEKNQYSQYGTSPNQEGIKQAIQETLDQVKLKPLM
jgi:hypothetical protein